MRLSVPQIIVLAKWNERPGLEPYGGEYATVNSLLMRGLMERAGSGFVLMLTERGRAALKRKQAA